MRTFEFRLERVLRWRETQVELEQFALARQAAECAQWSAELSRLEDERAAAESILLSSGAVAGGDLGSLSRYQEHLEKQRQIAMGRRKESERKMDEQRGRVLAAQRKFRLLEKLRYLRKAEWQIAVDREFEALAAETYLAQWPPRSRRPAGPVPAERP